MARFSCWGASGLPFLLISHDALPITGINSKPSLRTRDEKRYLSSLSEEADSMTGEISGIIKKNKGLCTLLHHPQEGTAGDPAVLARAPILRSAAKAAFPAPRSRACAAPCTRRPGRALAAPAGPRRGSSLPGLAAYMDRTVPRWWGSACRRRSRLPDTDTLGIMGVLGECCFPLSGLFVWERGRKKPQ